jgi:hypothetical protein
MVLANDFLPKEMPCVANRRKHQKNEDRQILKQFLTKNHGRSQQKVIVLNYVRRLINFSLFCHKLKLRFFLVTVTPS